MLIRRFIYCSYISIFFFCLSPFYSKAQRIDSVLRTYSEQFQPEKIHIHFDKVVYNKGETVWFKLYILAGFDLTDYSKNVYIDWFDEEGKILKHIETPIFESSARGQFDIPKDYKGKFLRIKAYTRWMLNFDSSFLYRKELVVNQPAGLKKIIPKQSSDIQFFPEGGDLVEGINCKVAFKIVNEVGLPVGARGAIKSINNELIDSFITTHDGMGYFSIESPKSAEKYTAYWKDEYGKIYSNPLPAVKKNGATIQVQLLPQKVVVVTSRTDDVSENMKILHLLASMNQQAVYLAKLKLGENKSSIGQIPTDVLTSGILQITLFTEDWLPIAERIVFVNNHKYSFTPSLNLTTLGLNRREKNVFEIQVPDSALSNLSIAVTDGGLGSDSSTNIISQLLLTGDLKGYVHHPAYYFSSNADSVAKNLDLVMLTHGWRKFKWDEVVKGSLPKLTYPKETDFLQIMGKIFGEKSHRIAPDQKVLLVLQPRDNGKKQSLFLNLKPDKTFEQSGVMFFDTIKVFYQFLGDKALNDASELVLQNGLLTNTKDKLVDKPLPYLFMIDTSNLARERLFAIEQAKLAKLLKTTNLDEVTVKAKSKKNLDLIDETYASGLFAGDAAYKMNLTEDPSSQGAINVFYYLQGRVPGLMISTQTDGQTDLRWRGSTTELFLDEIPTQPEIISTMSMADIAYIKVFRPPFFGATGGGAGGAISIYTRKGSDIQSKPGEGIPFKLLGGYTPYKEFYSPNYSVDPTELTTDARNTIYWNPFILIDGINHKAKVEFYNNDISRKMRVIIEGINSEGKLARVERLLE